MVGDGAPTVRGPRARVGRLAWLAGFFSGKRGTTPPHLRRGGVWVWARQGVVRGFATHREVGLQVSVALDVGGPQIREGGGCPTPYVVVIVYHAHHSVIDCCDWL